MRKVFSFIVEYFMLVVGLLFIFSMGAIYAVLRPQGILISVLFLVIGIGWVAYLIKYLWEIIDKRERK